MGKIILTERQYRNLNQILIGKEIENNKGRLNEMTEEETLEAKSVGMRINNLLTRCNGGLKPAKACTDEMNTALSALTTKEQFDEASKYTSYWVDSSYTPDRKWATNLGKFLEESGHDNPIPEATKFATYFKIAGGNLTFKKDADASGLLFKPNSFSLSWTAAKPAAVTPAAAGTTAAAATKARLINFNEPLSVEDITAFQRWYWQVKEKDQSRVSGDVDDICKAKYPSALCGGKPCIRTQAVDGKSGGNTSKLMTPELTDEFLKWKNANPDLLTKYSILDKCSSAEKGYTASVKTPSSTSSTSSRSSRSSAGGTGGGANELTGLV
jgi:hypothetical protein